MKKQISKKDFRSYEAKVLKKEYYLIKEDLINHDYVFKVYFKGVKPMKQKITIEDLALQIFDLTTVVKDGFKNVNDRLDKVEKRLDKVEKRLDRVEKRLDKVEKRLNRVEKRLDVIEKDLKAMKNTPTMQKELALIS